MPRSNWNEKEERQYEHIKKSELDRGRSNARAEEIAARTVNKQRRNAGKTQKLATSGTGNPNTSLEERSVDELRNRARALKVEGRSRMSKKELIRAIRRR
jgi:Rho termination factor, N-terminal domain